MEWEETDIYIYRERDRTKQSGVDIFRPHHVWCADDGHRLTSSCCEGQNDILFDRLIMLYKHKNYAIHRVCKRTRIIRFIHFDWWLCGCLFGLISSYFFSSAECREQSLMTFRWSWPHPSLNNVKHFASSNNTHFRSAAHWRIGLKQTKNNHFFSHITDAGSSSHWILIFFFFFIEAEYIFFFYIPFFFILENDRWNAFTRSLRWFVCPDCVLRWEWRTLKGALLLY